jgi:hypothetical protein
MLKQLRWGCSVILIMSRTAQRVVLELEGMPKDVPKKKEITEMN